MTDRRGTPPRRRKYSKGEESNIKNARSHCHKWGTTRRKVDNVGTDKQDEDNGEDSPTSCEAKPSMDARTQETMTGGKC